MQLKMKLQLPVEMQEENGWYISSCHVLDIHSQGRTEPEALKNIAEALELFLFSCFERGTLIDVLKESGFKLEQKLKPQKKFKATTKTVNKSRLLNIGIPFDYQNSRTVCHA
ncbi:MAG: type II toxin-antitoxin system HicB family antitoxin [Candidatus Scalindua sp.]|nr:type II toxin-antitoxin system HicB family antitoxin [Candidatus Scalindua sp.]